MIPAWPSGSPPSSRKPRASGDDPEVKPYTGKKNK